MRVIRVSIAFVSRNLKSLLSLAESTALAAGMQLVAQKSHWSAIETESGREVKVKGDRLVESMILQNLQGSTDFPILTEERGWQTGLSEEGYLWVVDPLDGSFNYYHDIPVSAVSIALYKGKVPVLGVVYDFNRHELFSGLVEEGAWLNKRPISVSDVKESERGILYTGFPVARDFNDANSLAFMTFARQWRKVRMIGSAAISLAYVASGRAEYYHERNTMFWDVAAGLALVVAAGGQVQFFGERLDAPQDVHANNGQVIFKWR